jgi:hypothetical protein
MSSPTEAEEKAFQSAVECIGMEARVLLEHLPPGEVLAALFAAATAVAAEHRIGSAPLIQIFSRALDGPLPGPTSETDG